MKKSINTVVALLAIVVFFHSTRSLAQNGRQPSVEPFVEIEINDTNESKNETGYNFNQVKTHSPVVARGRVPANIVSKNNGPSSSYWGPFIFLLTLPIGIWIVISKKIKSSHIADKAVDYYPKTQQFKPFKTEYQQSSEDDDDIDYPKAS